MRGKKWLTVITCITAVAALIIALLIGNEHGCVGYDIAMAVFGSGLLGFFMSLVEYIVERRNAMENFWVVARNSLAELRKIDYINTDAPANLIQACFQEERTNNFSKIFDSSVAEESKNALISWYEENTPMTYNERDNINAELEEIYSHQMESYRDSYMKCIDSCIEIAHIDLSLLDNAYGNLDFIFGNHNIRKDAYDNIYSMILKYRNIALEELFHFSLYKAGKGNFPLCAKKAYEICQKVFISQQRIEDDFELEVIYQTAFDDIAEALEKFRSKIYSNAEPDYPKRIPVNEVRIIKFEKDES